MPNENSLRDNVKDAIRGCLLTTCYAVSQDEDRAGEDSATIADAIFDALGINSHEQDYLASETSIKVLDSEKMAVEWCMADVMQQASDMKVEVTEKQAKEVLSLMDRKHDAENGICWVVIECWIDYVLAEDKKKADGAN